MKYRDLTIQEILPHQYLVVACDSSSGVGEKEGDNFFCPTRVVGAYCARVCLFELISSGVRPTVLVHMVGDSWEPTGREAYLGIQEELKKAGFEDVEINGSTEENMLTTMTSINITVMGIRHSLPPKMALREGDVLLLYGIPRVGPDVLTYEEEHVTYEELRAICNFSGVADVLPIGSRGVASEVRQMAETHHLKSTLYGSKADVKALFPFVVNELDGFDYRELLLASGGPSTSVLVGVPRAMVENFICTFPIAVPVAVLG